MDGELSTYCFSPESVGSPGAFGLSNFDYMLPVFLGQLLLVLFFTRCVSFCLEPLRQPKVIAEMLAGVMLGPSFLGTLFSYAYSRIPAQNYVLLDTAANFGLTYYMFMVAVEVDLRAIRTLGKKVVIIMMVGMVFALVVSFTSAYALGLGPDIVMQLPGMIDLPETPDSKKNVLPFLLFFSLAVSITGLPVLARIITEFKLLNSPLAPLSIGPAILNDIVAWILLPITLVITGDRDGKPVSKLVPLGITMAVAAFVLVCFCVVRPAIEKITRRTPADEQTNDFQLGIILAGVPAVGFLSDVIGIHSIFGAFIYGLAVPNGPLAEHLIERMEPFLVNLLLPLFFANCGLRTNINSIMPWSAIFSFIAVVILATLAKIVGTILVAMAYAMSFRDSLALGFLMSVKGPIEIIILNIAIDRNVFRSDMFAVVLLTSMLTTALAMPVVMLSCNKESKPLAVYRRRNVQGARSDVELRMLACVHNDHHVHSLMRLLDVSNPTKRSPIFVCVLHLVELAAARVSSMLIMHPTAHNSNYSRLHGSAIPSDQAQLESILAIIDGYEQHSAGVSFQPLTAFSPSTTMHEDVCSVAEERHACLIVLPFHKVRTIDGSMEEIGSIAVRPVNVNILANAPCSVAILVDCGIGGVSAALYPGAHRTSHHIAVIFIGGPDDREALAYACRMADHPAIVLTVIRFIDTAPPSRLQSISSVTDEESTSAFLADAEVDKEHDEKALDEFRLRYVSDESVVFTEKVVSYSEETVAALRAMESKYDLYLVGRGLRRKSALTSGLEEWSEFPELGPIGDLLVSLDFDVKVSVLVVQQYAEKDLAEAEWEALGYTGPLSQRE